MADPALASLLRRNAWQSAAINAGFSLAFFLLVFGLRSHALSMGPPDGFALDFLPQSAAVGLMSALVPVLATRTSVGRLTGRDPASPRLIVMRSLGFALAALVPGGVLAGLALVSPWPALGLSTALVFKLVYGAALGFVITPVAIEKSAQ
ncbi:hypothetical protein H7F50_17420 [Novosphingobium flavum]|uniref:hypothetical protein n=1 Tax=Novosphingobium aerophilum TaxID=2839843 RepID=UPI00163AD86C|nr:hypothetical protein [Novosphingobium aerophilum]MBC2663524.1 hypothetical protein [Novosphingobium aerophilum]